MPLMLLFLIALAAGAVLVALVALVSDRLRREALGRARGDDAVQPARSVLIAKPSSADSALRDRLLALIPTTGNSSVTRERLTQAGYDGIGALAIYGAARLTSVAGVTLLAMTFAPRQRVTHWLLIVAMAALIGAMLPVFYLLRSVRKRQERLLRSLPDAMDLLVLCVEAGLGFDAAMLNVARDMRSVHPDLAQEIMLVNRRVNAGMTREEALRAMYSRTAVEELRVLVQNLIQSDRLGTSIAKVLRVYAETLRRKRRQRAERRAATAALKMTFPLTGLILPALFVVILGPAMLRIFSWFVTR